MANLQYTASSNLSISGITPASGPKPTVAITAAFTSGGVAVGDYVSDTFVVNGTTTATAFDMGNIVTGKAIWFEASAPLSLILTQDLGAGPVDVEVKVDKFIFLQATFTAVKVANPGATAVNVSLSIMGDRVAVGAGPGVF
jgi:hypothetical protein